MWKKKKSEFKSKFMRENLAYYIVYFFYFEIN